MRVSTVSGVWRQLGPAQRRWIYLNALLATAVINVVVNVGIAWLSAHGEHRVPLWSIPVIDKPSIVTDTLGTLFLLPLITCLLCTTVVRRDVAAGRLPPLARTTAVETLAARVPATRMRRGIMLGALCFFLAAPFAVALIVAVDFADLTIAQFVLYKAVLSVVLGALVTPLIALLAMTDRPTTVTARSPSITVGRIE